MVKTINFKYYFTLFFISSYLIFIGILSLKGIPDVISNSQNELIRRDDNVTNSNELEVPYDIEEILTEDEKLKYITPGSYKLNIVHNPFGFIHVMWSAIASGFRLIYRISKENMIDVSNKDLQNIKDANDIYDIVKSVPGLMVFVVVCVLFIAFILLCNGLGCPSFCIITYCCLRTKYETIDYRPGKVLCGKIYFGIFSFLLTFTPLFCLLGYKAINNSVDMIAQDSKTLIYDVDNFIYNAEDVFQNKTTDIVFNTISDTVLDPIINNINETIISKALSIYDEAFKVIEEIISNMEDIKNNGKNGYSVLQDASDLIEEIETDFDNQISTNSLKNNIQTAEQAISNSITSNDNYENEMISVKDQLFQNNVGKLFNDTINTLKNSFEQFDSLTSMFESVNLEPVRSKLYNLYEKINDVEVYKNDVNDYSPNLTYCMLYLIIFILSIVIITLAFLKLQNGVKLTLITCIPVGTIFWCITIVFLLVSVLISQTCKTVYDLDTVTINKIVDNVSDMNDTIPFDIKFSILSDVLESCATEKDKDVSIWSVIEKEEFNGFVQTTCTIIEKYMEDIPLNCTGVVGRNDLIKNFITSLDITGKIVDEYGQFDLSENLGEMTKMPSYPSDFDIGEVSFDEAIESFNTLSQQIDKCESSNSLKDKNGCTKEKREEYKSKINDIKINLSTIEGNIETDIEGVKKGLNDLNDVDNQLIEFIGSISDKVKTIMDESVEIIKNDDIKIFQSIIDQTFNNVTKCQSWSQDIWILSNSVCHGILSGSDVIWWSSVIIAFLLTFNMFGGIHLIAYTIASLKYDGKNEFSSTDSDTQYDKKLTSPIVYVQKTAKTDEGPSDDASQQKDVLKTNVLEDFNNISKFCVDLDDGTTEDKENLNSELTDALQKRETLNVPSKELNDLLENGPKSNYIPDNNFNTQEEYGEEEPGVINMENVDEINEYGNGMDMENHTIENELYENNDDYDDSNYQ
ncbi:hypothetical protein BCR32DRAFT_327297 [Anaeromyces robustus]|uniref:Uncharacterized protein n=1 Tax=Anaeromyces robustus TaxID=1754192 RepID=A0A1Y1X6V8_9FUNG|nr:hypothetical protein BCR32DRAFT_327297 [Anaeromyces robustus]|eukprot:ORX81523.1 hypothetical protein BCR32DRAFT_327297 [Anaeromyces robustus]